MGKTFEELAYEDAVKYPYDENYKGEEDLCRLIARAVLGDLWGRSGIGNVMDEVDIDTRLDILSDITAIIRYGLTELE